ncbi:hypothetical protein M758_1G179100 [Ceratodon purpureus]|nr:hypothetical protein M758_1G179100 [Ceratodon purpureus]
MLPKPSRGRLTSIIRYENCNPSPPQKTSPSPNIRPHKAVPTPPQFPFLGTLPSTLHNHDHSSTFTADPSHSLFRCSSIIRVPASPSFSHGCDVGFERLLKGF